jgi:hypothetical protein
MTNIFTIFAPLLRKWPVKPAESHCRPGAMGASESRQRDNDDDNPHPLPDFVHCGEISHLSSPILAAFDVLCLENIRTNARAMRGL